MATAPGGMKRSVAAIVVVIMFIASPQQSGPAIVNIAYGRSWPRSIAIDPGRQLAYVDGESGIYPPDGFSFGVVSLANQSLGRVLGLPGIAGELALDAGSDTVYAAGQDSVTVIDAQDMTIEKTMALKIPIFSIAFDGSTGHLLITSGNSLFQLDPTTGRLLRNATVGESAEGMAVDTARGVVFVANYLSSSVSVLRTADLALVGTVRLPSVSYPSQLSLDSKRGVLYSTTDAENVVRVDSRSYDVLGSIQVSKSSMNGTYALAVDPARDRLFVATEPGTTISELNATTGALLSTFSVQSAAFEMAADQGTGNLYVTDYHQITAITPSEVIQQAPQYGALPVLVGLAIALVGGLYLWRFSAIGGMRGGPRAQPQKALAWRLSSRRRLRAVPRP